MRKQNGVEKEFPRTAQGLRDALFDEWEALRRGESTPQKARATALLAGQIISSVRMEIDYATAIASGQNLGIQPMSRPLPLGRQ